MHVPGDFQHQLRGPWADSVQCRVSQQTDAFAGSATKQQPQHESTSRDKGAQGLLRAQQCNGVEHMWVLVGCELVQG